MKTISVLVFFFLFFLIAEARRKKMTDCAKTFSCGSLDFRFPFFNTTMRSRCGLFRLKCTDHQISEMQLEENGKWYKVKSVSQANTITITDPRLNKSLEAGSCTDLSNFSLPDSPWLELTTLYKCNNSRENGFTYANCKGGGSSLYYSNLTDHSGCSIIKTPESWNISRNKNQSIILNATFSLRTNVTRACRHCYRRGGECTMIKDKFHCRGGGKEDYQDVKLKLGLGIGGFLILIISLVALFIFIQRNWRRKTSSDLISTYNSNSDVEFSHVFFKIPIFSYKELQEATDNFSKDRLLGDGGFGTVYYGKVRVFVSYTSLLEDQETEEDKKVCSSTKVSVKFEVIDDAGELVTRSVLKCGFSMVYEPEGTDHDKVSWEVGCDGPPNVADQNTDDDDEPMSFTTQEAEVIPIDGQGSNGDDEGQQQYYEEECRAKRQCIKDGSEK